jgi:hypothetical protein
MTTRWLVHGLRLLVVSCAAALAISGPASAHGGFGGGGGHGGGGFGGGGFHGGGFHGGGFHGGWHGGYGHGYGYGRGGYGYGGWGWGNPWLYGGLWLDTLPFYYSQLWWDGVPYYYAGDNYYVWNGTEDAYQAVDPPPQVVQQARTAQGLRQLYAYPKNGQSSAQQAQDKLQCESWAAAQVGLTAAAPSPTLSGTGAPGANPPLTSAPAASSDPYASQTLTPEQREQYLRAEGACLQGRGYSVD